MRADSLLKVATTQTNGELRPFPRVLDEVKMRKLVLLTCLAFSAATFASAATAKHHHHRHKHWVHVGNPAPARESLTTVGTPDCHVQGRFLRMAHHCPPEAIAAAPR